MTDTPLLYGLLDGKDSLQRENDKLKRIVSKLMARVEQSSIDRAQGYTHFERSIVLEEEVRLRTQNLREVLEELSITNARLLASRKEAEEARLNLADAIEAIQEGFAIFDACEKLVMKNSRFSQLLPDVVGLVTQGIAFVDYVRLCAHSSHVVLPKRMSVQDWVEERLLRHATRSTNFVLALRHDHWLQVSEQRMSDGGTIILQTDITDHVRREREQHHRILDQQARITKATLEHMEQGILIFDRKSRLVAQNEAALKILKLPRSMVDYHTRASRFMPVFQAGHCFDAESQPERIYQWLASPNGRAELRYEVKAFSGAQYEVFAQEINDGSVVISFHEITRLKQAYQKLTQINETLELRVAERTLELEAARDAALVANASKSRFVVAVSHDLLQPINAAKLFISSLEQSALSDKQSSTLKLITQSFQSVESILGSLLDISRLDSGKVALRISEFSVASMLRLIQAEYAPLAQDKGIVFKVCDSSAFVRSDPVYLRRIIQNLVSNAIRYTNQGKVLVGVRRRRDGAEFVVHDTGIGIAPEEQEKVFEEFHRIEWERHGENSMGLGLTIVDRACKMLDHRLTMSSAPGQGSSFRIKVAYADCTHD